MRCAQETAAEMQPGWSERQTARFMRSWLADHGVHDYFHRPLVFFGDRTRYQGFGALRELAPTDQVLRDDDVYVLDVGPIVDGFASDISIYGMHGRIEGFAEASDLLATIKRDIPALVKKHKYCGKKVWSEIRHQIERHGFDAVHYTSAYSFFGHRLNGTAKFPLARFLAKRGQQTYTEFLARGLAGQLWSEIRRAPLCGIWAVEPHIGAKSFGIKFEESLIVTPDHVGWLSDFTP